MDNAIIGNLALMDVADKVESKKPSKAIRLSELSIGNVKRKRKRGLISVITEKVANKKINKEIEKYQQNIKELTERKEELSSSRYMIEQGIVDKLDNKINITEKTIVALQKSKEIIHKGNKPLRMASYMIKLIKEKTNKRLNKIDNYKIQTEKDSNIKQPENPPVIESSSTIERVGQIPAITTSKIAEDDNKIIPISRKMHSEEPITEINPIDALVKETMARQSKVEEKLKEEQTKLKEATEQKNNNIIELQKAIEERNKQIAEKEAELQRKREKVEKEREEAARIEAALKLLGNNANDNNVSKSM